MTTPPFARLPDLDEAGFTIIPGPVPDEGLAGLSAAYDATVDTAPDIKVGSSTTRVKDVNRGAAFDELYIYPPVLEACRRIINEPFRLSTMNARTVPPKLPAQNLHVDFARDSHGWTMVGFIFSVNIAHNAAGRDGFLHPASASRAVRFSVIRPQNRVRGTLSLGFHYHQIQNVR